MPRRRHHIHVPCCRRALPDRGKRRSGRRTWTAGDYAAGGSARRPRGHRGGIPRNGDADDDRDRRAGLDERDRMLRPTGKRCVCSGLSSTASGRQSGGDEHDGNVAADGLRLCLRHGAGTLSGDRRPVCLGQPRRWDGYGAELQPNIDGSSGAGRMDFRRQQHLGCPDDRLEHAGRTSAVAQQQRVRQFGRVRVSAPGSQPGHPATSFARRARVDQTTASTSGWRFRALEIPANPPADPSDLGNGLGRTSGADLAGPRDQRSRIQHRALRRGELHQLRSARCGGTESCRATTTPLFPANTTYRYQVRAFNLFSPSNYSNIADALTPAPPPPPPVPFTSDRSARTIPTVDNTEARVRDHAP